MDKVPFENLRSASLGTITQMMTGKIEKKLEDEKLILENEGIINLINIIINFIKVMFSFAKNNSLVNNMMFMQQQPSYGHSKNTFYIKINDESEICCMLYEYISKEDSHSIDESKKSLSPKPIIILCHGNACDIGQSKNLARELCKSTSCHILLMEYPGYGMSSKITTTEDNCKLSIEVTINFLRDNLGVPINNIILYGQSIGSGIATYGLKYCFDQYNEYPGGLILISPYLSIKKLSQDIIGSFVPMFDRLNTEENIKFCKKTHVLVVHGRCDEVIPVHHGEELSEIASEISEFDVIKVFPCLATHNDFNFSNDICRHVVDIVSKIKVQYKTDIHYNLLNIKWNRQTVDPQQSSEFMGCSSKTLGSTAATSTEFTSASSSLLTNSCYIL